MVVPSSTPCAHMVAAEKTLKSTGQLLQITFILAWPGSAMVKVAVWGWPHSSIELPHDRGELVEGPRCGTRRSVQKYIHRWPVTGGDR